MDNTLIFTNIKEHPSYENALLDLIKQTWGAITLNSQPLQKYWKPLFQHFPAYQFVLHQNNSLIGYACSIPFHWSAPLSELPQEGWDWLLENGIQNRTKSLNANYLGGLMIGVLPAYRGQGWSKYILQQLKVQTKKNDFEQLIIPIRPTLKDKHPLISMQEYMNWKKEEMVFDPWIRTHLNSGAHIIKVCEKAMTIKGSIEEWKNWTGENISQSGKQVIQGTLAPVQFDIKKNIGIYEEPNIWINYTV